MKGWYKEVDDHEPPPDKLTIDGRDPFGRGVQEVDDRGETHLPLRPEYGLDLVAESLE